MKIFIALCFYLSFFLYTAAQQKPQYTQYVLNNYLLNPALSGVENYTDVKLGYRQQWAGLADAPKTAFVSAHWALGSEYLWSNALSFDEKGNDPRSRSYQQYYTASPAHHGVGFSAVNDKAGQLTTTAFNLSYAYHLILNDKLNMSVGIAGGFTRIGIDANRLLLENPNDPSLGNAIESQFKPDVSAGIWLYGSRFFSGISVQQLRPQQLSFSDDGNYNQGKQVPHFFLTGGYKLYVSEDMHLIPSVMVKAVQGVPLSVDANLKLGLKDKVWIGAGYRNQDAVTVMAGVNVSSLINVTYAYDFTTSGLNQVSTGSHEIVLGFLLNNVYKVICPRNMW
ncbi:PorP/SprF family type IX secretion system membrane protein [Pedobacter rhodius]|uniref:Type IX secretion system membrane protein PorP/SprF n=1 Tax=Pedobacter rhodius TaxID=3004098 RepID=A0ABT4KUA2_9SPHI|nr:type IX secretion system membrane protein PorP/SprF [Pedobacter sp. SJ11]MCZ4222518.1 type IX secretion system membrane protein PorP/SprF [Pedobacter sp. SJ11]